MRYLRAKRCDRRTLRLGEQSRIKLSGSIAACRTWDELAAKARQAARSLSDLREIGCKSVWTVHISPLFWAIEPTIALQKRQNLPSPSQIFASIP